MSSFKQGKNNPSMALKLILKPLIIMQVPKILLLRRVTSHSHKLILLAKTTRQLLWIQTQLESKNEQDQWQLCQRIRIKDKICIMQRVNYTLFMLKIGLLFTTLTTAQLKAIVPPISSLRARLIFKVQVSLKELLTYHMVIRIEQNKEDHPQHY
jgi:hypothetical protein